MPKKFWKTTIQVEVLSESKYDFESLEQVVYDITEGDCSGASKVVEVKSLTEKEAAAALIAQGSDPDFFQL